VPAHIDIADYWFKSFSLLLTVIDQASCCRRIGMMAIDVKDRFDFFDAVVATEIKII
jgi:hypothetical protein